MLKNRSLPDLLVEIKDLCFLALIIVPRKVVAASQGPRTAVVKAVPVPVAKLVIKAVPAASSVISRTSFIATVPRRQVVTKPIGKAVPVVAVKVSKRAINIKPTSYSVVPTTDSALTMSTKRKFDQFRGAMQTASTSAEVRSCVGLGAERLRV
ncbi:hypothetical protein QFC21_003248 [Naganishia friedmannii]|uniref:Uncharacterized protein n=1 Tax=Naganishia friedmannii TaxID=89922 RepID=A0ACC2VPP0_9TREE|nr:hypothetical protein QFC21_003248 [Naganishia friedmannii]